MSEGSNRSGFYVSGALHAALLGMILIGFSQAPKFDDAAEAIPVDTLTQSQFNEIMKGERDAKPAKPAPPPPQREFAVATPIPPEPPPDLREVDDTPPPPTPASPQPPVRPAPETPPPPPKPVAEQPPVKPPPTPPAKPPPPAPPKPIAEEAPEPPVRPTPTPPPPPVKPPPPKLAAEEPREPPVRPKVAEKPKETTPPEKPSSDPLAKAAAKDKTERSTKDASRPPAKPYDPNAIAKLIGQTKVADATPTGATPQGLPNQHAARMSLSLSAALDAWFTEAYLACWSPPPTTPEGERYIADVRVIFNPDGSLSGQPVLLNPPRDPAWRAHAESAVRAVLKCNPLKLPPQYAPYFEQWKSKTIHFDPESALG